MNGNWFPWSEGVNGNQAGEYVTAWRHVHDIFTAVGATNVTWVWCPNVDYSNSTSPASLDTPATPTSTGPASTATTGAPTRPSPTAGRASTSSTSSTYRQIVETIAPVEADDDRRGRLDRVRRLEGGLDQGHAGQLPTEYPKIRALLWFDKYDERHGLADRDLDQRHQRLRRRASRAPPTPATPSPRSAPRRSCPRADAGRFQPHLDKRPGVGRRLKQTARASMALYGHKPLDPPSGSSSPCWRSADRPARRRHRRGAGARPASCRAAKHRRSASARALRRLQPLPRRAAPSGVRHAPRIAPPLQAPPAPAAAAQPALLGRHDRRPADRRPGALGHERGLQVRADGRQAGLAGPVLPALRRLLRLAAAPSTASRPTPMDRHPRPRLDPGPQLELAVDPLEPRTSPTSSSPT